jgi:cytochrome c oxidase cbb3-type subunit III
MNVRTGLIAAAAAGLMMAAAVRVTGQAAQQEGQQPPAQPPSQEHGGPPPPDAPPPQAPQNQARFPAHQRPQADPATLERGRGLYVGSCGPCHGIDARGGQLGGPNLLRSALVLNDQDGELIIPLVQNGRPGTAMVPIKMSEPDIKAITAYLHHLQAMGSNQGGPPPGEEEPLDILVGDAGAGADYFQAKCSSCHSASGDLQGLAARVTEPKALQNLWVSGGRAVGRGRRGGGGSGTAVTATVTLPSGETIEGRLVRLDDFLVTLALEDGSTRTVRRNGDDPWVEVHDPLEAHDSLLAVLTDADMHNVTAYLATLK